MLIVWTLWIRPLSDTSRATSKQPERNSDPPQNIPSLTVSEARDSSKVRLTVKDVMEGLTEIPSQAEVDAFLQEQGRSKANLLAASTLTSDISYLQEALRLYPNSPSILIAILTRDITQANAIELAETLAFIEPDNALGHYLYGKVLLDAGEIDAAFAALSDGASVSSFQATFTEQVEGLTAFYQFQGSSPDLALIQSAFGANLNHLGIMRDLAKELTTYNSQGDINISIGVAMGNHLSQGAGSQLLINQLNGLYIEKQFLETQPPETYNLFLNQTHGELLRDIEKQRSQLLESVKKTNADMDQMTLEEGAKFARIMIKEGEAVAMQKLFRK